ncbi:hypothetical protein [Acinetobacter bereziniae]|uniref:hypothetical protein n=1 Tax=Acinetobacter bereziniae TaxID=106648 RepID=UPI003AF5C976
MKFDFLVATAIGIFGILIAVISVYYTRHSYLLTLKAYEKDKKRTEKAKYYYETYINIPPSKEVNVFLKKVDSDDLNEGVAYPSEYTDYIMKNFPDQYFRLAALLKKSWVYFEIREIKDTRILSCKITHFAWLQGLYFILYFIFAMLFSSLALYSNLLINKITVDSPWAVVYMICMGCLGLIALSLFSLLKTTQISEAKRLNNELKKVLPPFRE